MQTLELLEEINRGIGWKGVGDNDEEQFYCEHCQATHLDYTQIQHADNCLVTKVRGAIAALSAAADFDRIHRAIFPQEE